MGGMGDRNPESGVQWLDQGFTLPVGVAWQGDAPATGPRMEITDDPDLHVLIAGLAPQRLKATFEELVCRIPLPEDAGLVWLLSRSYVPREITGWPDSRSLGLPISRVTVDGWDLPLDDDAFREGWHAVESGFRWTNGRAALMLKAGARRLELTLNPHCPLTYPRQSEAAAEPTGRAVASRTVSPRTLAVVTMAYNERDMLPLWLRHYGAQVGLEHCYVIDDGSDDGSTAGIAPANLMRMPRQPFDDEKRGAFVSEFCSSLLKYYDHVAYADADEIILADPRHHVSLPAFCVATEHDVVTAIGLNVQHIAGDEPPLDPHRSISEQRRWVQPLSSMCKPMITRRPIRWTAGFHGANAPPVFDHLFNFHLGYCDRDLALRRQAKRRDTLFATENARHHHRFDDGQLVQMLDSWAALPPVATIDLDTECLDTRHFVRDVLGKSRREGEMYQTDLGIWVPQLWRIPNRFVGVF